MWICKYCKRADSVWFYTMIDWKTAVNFHQGYQNASFALWHWWVIGLEDQHQQRRNIDICPNFLRSVKLSELFDLCGSCLTSAVREWTCLGSQYYWLTMSLSHTVLEKTEVAVSSLLSFRACRDEESEIAEGPNFDAKSVQGLSAKTFLRADNLSNENPKGASCHSHTTTDHWKSSTVLHSEKGRMH